MIALSSIKVTDIGINKYRRKPRFGFNGPVQTEWYRIRSCQLFFFIRFFLSNKVSFLIYFSQINGITNEFTKYGQLAQEATNLAVSLTHLGVKKGEVVAIMAENRKEYFGIFVGIACTGAVVTTLNYLYSEGNKF